MKLRFDRVITIERATESKDDFGGVSVTWSTYATLRAHIDNSQENEDYEAERKTARTKTVFRIRSSATSRAITPKFRVQYGGKVYEIDSIYEDTEQRRRGFIVVECVQKAV